MGIIISEVETTIEPSISGNLKFLGQDPIASIRHCIQHINLFLIDLRVDKLIVGCTRVKCHVWFQALFEIAFEHRLPTGGVVRQS